MSAYCNDFDTPWKDILECYFQLFMEFCFPDIAAQIDWSRQYELLDKELSAIQPDAELGNREVDKLFKVWRLNGEEAWVMFHIEIQGQKVQHFEERMFVYHYRLFDRYAKPIVSLAILTDNNTKWRPCVYQHNLWGCKLEFQFLVVKLQDYMDKKIVLDESNNPFALVIAAQLAAIQAKQTDQDKYKTKLDLIQTLYSKNFTEKDIMNLYTFIDWIIHLPEPLAIEYNNQVLKLEEQRKMAYVTTAERLGIEKGFQQGIQQGLEQGIEKGELYLLRRQLIRKFGELPLNFSKRLETAHADELLQMGDRILEANSLEEVFDY